MYYVSGCQAHQEDMQLFTINHIQAGPWGAMFTAQTWMRISVLGRNRALPPTVGTRAKINRDHALVGRAL